MIPLTSLGIVVITLVIAQLQRQVGSQRIHSISMKGTVDPANPNVINVSRTWSNDGETQYTFTVKMVRCQ